MFATARIFLAFVVAFIIAEAMPNTAKSWIHGAIAQGNYWVQSGLNIYYNTGNVSIGTTTNLTLAPLEVVNGISVTCTNPSVGNDANERRCLDVRNTVNTSNSNPDFTNEENIVSSLTATNGRNFYSADTQVKTTFFPLNIYGNYTAAGQKFILSKSADCKGMGDCFMETKRLTFSGGPVSGDEGQSWASVGTLGQPNSLSRAAIASIPAQTTCNTTLTQAVTRNISAQAVSVASTTNCNVNDWVVIDQAFDQVAPNIEAVQITAVGGGRITAVFSANHQSGRTVTPAKVLVLDSFAGSGWGQDREVVNLSGASYTTGTVASIDSSSGFSKFVGSGTTWANNMVGGSATNIGCASLDNDTFNGSPFNGSGATSPLRSWYVINSVIDATHFSIISFEVAANISYRGNGVGSGGYQVRPCARALRINGTTIIMETTAATWTVGDTLEQAINPYPYVVGYQDRVQVWTPGMSVNAYFDLKNVGARAMASGYSCDSVMATGSGAQTYGWESCVIANKANYGLRTNVINTAAIYTESAFSSGSVTDNASKIVIGGPYVMMNTPNEGIYFQTTPTGAGGLVTVKSPNITLEDRPRWDWDGAFGLTRYISGIEITAPSAPAANGWRIYGKDNGAGKTQICALFNTGAEQCFATQP